MEYSKGTRIYRTIMLVLVTILITLMITAIGLYNYFTKTNKGVIEVLTAHIKMSDDTNSVVEKLELTKKQLEEKYLGELDEDKMIESAIKGYVEGVGDEYTQYLTKEEYEELTMVVNGDYVGIGIYMSKDDKNNIIVVMPMENSPAEEAGIKEGDIIVSVDDEKCDGTDLEKIANKIKGIEGTEVKLEILRDDEIITKTVKRRKVEIKNSDYKILDNNIGYIIFTTFDTNCTEKIKQYLNEFQEKGIDSVIIDVRNNAGGAVTEAISFSELFLEKGNVIMKLCDKDKKDVNYKSNAKETYNMRIVLLVSQNSASATEIVAAALQENERAKIVGTKTYGKGVMQEVEPFLDGALKITIKEFKTPNGNTINKVGVTPDIIVEDDSTTEEDEQLQEAIKIIQQ